MLRPRPAQLTRRRSRRPNCRRTRNRRGSQRRRACSGRTGPGRHGRANFEDVDRLVAAAARRAAEEAGVRAAAEQAPARVAAKEAAQDIAERHAAGDAGRGRGGVRRSRRLRPAADKAPAEPGRAAPGPGPLRRIARRRRRIARRLRRLLLLISGIIALARRLRGADGGPPKIERPRLPRKLPCS